MAGTRSYLSVFVKNLRLVFTVPVFTLFFSFLYDPYGVQDSLEVGGFSYSFHFMMLFCIMLVSLLISRSVFSAFDKEDMLSQVQKALWIVIEIFAMTAFIALYVALFKAREQSYFYYLSACSRYLYTVVLYPYVFFWLMDIIDDKNRELQTGPVDNSLLKLYDEHHRLKLSIDPKAILYFQAESNYYKVFYLEGDRIREFLLRNSMKSLGEPAGRHGIVRCHRSYYVNPIHISVLRKDKDGLIYADMKHEAAKPVPVSKNYFEALSKVL